MKLKFFIFLSIVTVLTCSLVWIRLQIVNISYDISKLEKMTNFLKEDCNKLSLKINELKSPEHLENLARTKLSMHPLQAGQIIVLKKSHQ